MSDDESEDELIPHHLIEELINWMMSAGYSQIHLVARAMPDDREREPVRDESRHLFNCDEEPDATGLLDIFAVSGGDGEARINGPTEIPHHVLRPLIQALDEASVSELVIAASDASPSPVLTKSRIGDIEEHAVPSAGLWPIIACQVLEDD